MKNLFRKWTGLIGLVLIVFSSGHFVSFGQVSAGTRFLLKYSPEVSAQAISGRALIILSADTLIDPDLPNPMNPFIVIGSEFKNWKSGEELVVKNSNSDGFLSTVNDLDGAYSMRVILDVDTTSSNLQQAGILYGDKTIVKVQKGKSSQVPALVNQIYPGKKFKEGKLVKEVRMQSKMLSDFLGYPAYIEGTAFLPESYDSEPNRHYPTVFVFPGWGTNHISASLNNMQQMRYGMSGFSDDKIYVLMNQDCRWGFHVFADSDNNGPRATSFIEEFLPWYESQYRAVKNGNARFLVGQSSGAWASVWLLIHYPDQFAMSWAGSPDPLSFKDFVGHDLYDKKANFFYDKKGQPTKAMRSDEIAFTNKDWSDLERAMGEGGQYQSFEAVFGTRGKDRKPSQFFDRNTGKIFSDELKRWKSYDIDRYIRRHAGELKDKISGKIHVVVAGDDSFYLNGSVELFDQTMKELGIDADIRILTSGGHNTWSEEIKKELHAEMDKIIGKNI